MTYILDPFQRIIFLPQETFSSLSTMDFNLTGANLTVSYPPSVSVPVLDDQIGASGDVRWNPSGNLIAFGYESTLTANSTCVAVYSWNGSSLSLVQKFVNAQRCTSGDGGHCLQWLDDNTLFVLAAGSGSDRGLTKWVRSGGTFTKTAQVTSGLSTYFILLTPHGIVCGRSIFSSSDLSFITQIYASGSPRNCAYYNDAYVFEDGDSYDDPEQLSVYRRLSATSYVKETNYPTFNQYGFQGNLTYPNVFNMEFRNNILICTTQYYGYNPAAVIFRRNGANSWTRLFEVPSDPEQTNQSGSGWSGLALDWVSDSEFVISRFYYLGVSSVIYRYSWNGSSAALIQQIPSIDALSNIDHHPSQRFIAATGQPNTPQRIYSY